MGKCVVCDVGEYVVGCVVWVGVCCVYGVGECVGWMCGVWCG